jgi:ubiquinone/menaquinone biosynthesis C-methylase UbiE
MAQQTVFGLTSDLSPIASHYDATRDLPEPDLLPCFDRLIERGLFPPDGVVLDVGCGSGQLSLPLAKRGYEVLGIDISAEMIKLAQSKVRQGWNAGYTVADVRCMPNDDASVDAVVVSKLFQHIQDWEKACHQLIRVVRPGGYIVQVKERGAFGNSVRRYFSHRATERGFASLSRMPFYDNRHVGCSLGHRNHFR